MGGGGKFRKDEAAPAGTPNDTGSRFDRWVDRIVMTSVFTFLGVLTLIMIISFVFALMDPASWDPDCSNGGCRGR